MSIWVKICGSTSLTDAQLAVDAGADAVGFVFAPSPRRVTADQIAAITPHLPSSIEKIGVFVDADLPAIEAAVVQAGLTGVQIHSRADASLCLKLRQRFATRLRILQVIHFGDNAVPELSAAVKESNLDGILIDSRTAEAVGGTGKAFDWNAARSSLFNGRSALKLIAAGGLTPVNVAQAIATMQPWGVDVVTGVEHSPGIKDPQKVLAFVRNAHAASDTLS